MDAPNDLTPEDLEQVEQILAEVRDWFGALLGDYAVDWMRNGGGARGAVWREVVRRASESGFDAKMIGPTVTIRKPGSK